ncbi:MAG: hypothetical protein AAFW73_17650 [Bacteroidota bacterium]
MKRLCIIGLDARLVQDVRERHFGPFIYHPMLPRFQVLDGVLYIEKSSGVGMLPVDRVVFHGIYEDDFDLLTALAIWAGPCFPNPLGMMNCRLKLPCLARALRVSRFNTKRGMVGPGTRVRVDRMTVGKWGNWHCGENKVKFDTQWTSEDPAVIEPFFPGRAVRVVSIGDQHLQINLEGDDWLKSIHHPTAAITELDPELLADTLALKAHFGLAMLANDYIVGEDGEKHLLEVNHIPNVTRFAELEALYRQYLFRWLAS